MQIIWVSGTTSKMKQIKITGSSVIKLAALSISTFILIGIGVHFLGFRVAIHFSPEITKQMGGVITRKELDEIEITYQEKLAELEKQAPLVASQVSKLETLKDQFSELATHSTSKNNLNMRVK
jgi:hypothetical protein